MRILELELLAYGPFTDAKLDFAGKESGLQIIYGPNEAGKSSTLRAIHGLLYGIRPNTTDNFLHDNKKLRIGGRLVSSGGEELYFHRRKGNKDTLLNPLTEQGGAFPDSVLEPFIRGVDRQTFSNVFGIGYSQLEHGGQEMADLRGLVGESLFAATVGGPGLAKLMRDLEGEASSVFASRKSSSAIKKLAARRKEVEKEKHALRLTMSNWKRLQADLRKARGHRDDVVSREQELSRHLQRLKRIQNSKSLIAKWRDVLKRSDELRDVTLLPDGYSPDDRNQVENDLAVTRRRREQLQRRLEGDGGLRSQVRSIQIPEGLLDFEDAITDLQDRRAVTEEAKRDTVKIQRKIETLEVQANDLLRDLGVDGSLESVEQYRVRPEEQVVIHNLASDARRLREQPRLLARRREDVELAQAQLQQERDELGEPRNVAGLEAVLSAGLNPDDAHARREELQADLDVATRSVEQQFSTLGLWTGSLSKLKKLVLPLEETVQRFREDFAQQESAAELLRHEGDKLRDELGQVRQEIAALQTAGSVPTEDELNVLRHARDELWQSVRDDWLREVFSKSMPISKAEKLASQFARSMSESDQLADRLRRETERVAQLAGHTARQERLEQQIQSVEAGSATVAKQSSVLASEWKKFWKSIGVTEPLSPNEMLGWLRRLNTLRDTLIQSDGIEVELKQHLADEKEAADRLRTELKSIGEKALVRESLRTLATRATDLVSTAKTQQAESRRLDSELKQLSIQLESLEREEHSAAEELAEWQSEWARRMKLLGCDVDTTAEQANERISTLNRVFDLIRQIREEQKRVDEIQSDGDQFAREAMELASRFLDEAGVDAADAVSQLYQMLQKARADQNALERLHEDEHNTTKELIDQQKAEEALLLKLDSLCRLAGVADAASLPEMERTSVELAELVRRRHDLEDQLHEQAGGQQLEDFAADADTEDADELPAKIELIESELEGLRLERDEAVGAVRELENLANEADGNDEAANLDQESLGILARMHDEAERYMQLRLAGTMLRKQIEVHRAENEDPLLRRASDLFSEMTCGDYGGLQIDYEADKAVIVGTRVDEGLVHVPAMSDGTRNQLYLALRLAYVEDRLKKSEPMPFIVDDILIHFDNQRSAATLNVLSRLAEQTQVIFLTHHSHLLELAHEHLPSGSFETHRFDRHRAALEQSA